MNDRELLRAMDACRSGSDDLELPEMQALKKRLVADAGWQQAFHHLQRLDQDLSGHLADVPVPPDLRQRILGRLATSAAPASALSGPSATEQVQASRWIDPFRFRRRALAALAAGLLATAASLFLVLYAIQPDPNEQITPARLSAWAIDDWIPDPAAWKPYDSLRSEEGYRPSRFVRTIPTRWQGLPTELDRQMVVYELKTVGQARARLFVLRVAERLPQLPARPPENPLVGSRGWYTAAWQEGPHVYVLAMEGSPQNYYEILRPGSPTLAVQIRCWQLPGREQQPLSLLRLAQTARPARG